MDTFSALAGAGLAMLVLFVIWRGRYAKDELDHLLISSFMVILLLVSALVFSQRSAESISSYCAGAVLGCMLYYIGTLALAIPGWRRKAKHLYNIMDYGAREDGIHDNGSGFQHAASQAAAIPFRPIVVTSGTKAKHKGGRR